MGTPQVGARGRGGLALASFALAGLALAGGPLACAAPASSPSAAAAAPAVPAARTPRAPRRPPTVYTPEGAGARHYEAAPLRATPARPERGRDQSPERALLDVVAEIARKEGAPPPQHDPRLDKVARDLVKSSRGMRPPPTDVVRFFANHYGVVEPDPAIYTLVGPVHWPGVHEQYRRSLGKVFARGEWNRMGVAYGQKVIERNGERGNELTVVVTLWEQLLDLAPIPRELPSEGRTPVRLRLRPGLSSPQLVVTLPTGAVRALPTVAGKDGRLDSELRCGAGDGRYQLEVLATGKMGPTVLANFPVFCGVRAPNDISAYDEDEVEEIDPADAEQELFALINQARMAAGLRLATFDNRLAAIARAHSRDMLNNNFVAHVSPSTGSAEQRVKRAGLNFPLLLENVGQEGGVLQAHRGFMASPGHRANVLHPHVSRVGIGVAVKTSGGAPLIVTELFAAE